MSFTSSLRASSARRIAANRRNALKSTGPRTAAGKRRVALNPRSRGLCPEELGRQLRARGEDPREFCRLKRDLIAIFHPADAAGNRALELLALTWWQKARRLREWVASGPARTSDLDTQIESLLIFLVQVQRRRHEPWQRRLRAVLGSRLGSPADVRRKIEARLFVFGAKPGKRTYPRGDPKEQLLRQFEQLFGPIPPVMEQAGTAQEAESRGEDSGGEEASKAEQTQ